MNKHLRAREVPQPAPRTPSPTPAVQAGTKPRSWKTGLVVVAVAFAIYSFFGQFFLPYPYRWSTISGGVTGGTEGAAVEASLHAKENAARVTARASAEGEIAPRVTQAEEIAKVEIDKQKQLNELDLVLTAQKAPILADQSALSAEATLYSQCLARADAAAEDAAAQVAGNTEGLGTTLAAVTARREIVSMSLRRQCEEAKELRNKNREQARANTPAESE